MLQTKFQGHRSISSGGDFFISSPGVFGSGELKKFFFFFEGVKVREGLASVSDLFYKESISIWMGGGGGGGERGRGG